VTIDPWLGGRVYARHSDIGEHNWGEVTVWEPGRRFAHAFTLAQDPQHPSKVAVEFVLSGAGSGHVRAWRLDGGHRRRAGEVRRLARHARPVRSARDFDD
jgi:hypothetical protein